MQTGRTREPRFAIVTDSACDLPYEYYADHDVALVPLHVRIDGTDLLDLVDISPEDFFVKLACAKGETSTSYPAPAEFTSVYQRLIDEGAAAIISVHISAALSGTIASATTAAREARRSVRCEVLDSKTASAAEGMVVRSLVEARDAGLGVDEALARVKPLIDAAQLFFIPAASAKLKPHTHPAMSLQRFLAGMTGMRPLLHIDEQGQLVERSSSVDVSDSAGLIARIMSRTSAKCGPLRYVEISSGMPRTLSILEKPLDTNEFVSHRAAITNTCPSVTSRVGIGAVGIAFAPECLLTGVPVLSDSPSNRPKED